MQELLRPLLPALGNLSRRRPFHEITEDIIIASWCPNYEQPFNDQEARIGLWTEQVWQQATEVVSRLVESFPISQPVVLPSQSEDVPWEDYLAGVIQLAQEYVPLLDRGISDLSRCIRVALQSLESALPTAVQRTWTASSGGTLTIISHPDNSWRDEILVDRFNFLRQQGCVTGLVVMTPGRATAAAWGERLEDQLGQPLVQAMPVEASNEYAAEVPPSFPEPLRSWLQQHAHRHAGLWPFVRMTVDLGFAAETRWDDSLSSLYLAVFSGRLVALSGNAVSDRLRSLMGSLARDVMASGGHLALSLPHVSSRHLQTMFGAGCRVELPGDTGAWVVQGQDPELLQSMTEEVEEERILSQVRSDLWNDVDAIVQEAMAQQRAGRTVLVLLNTVDRANDVFNRIRDLDPEVLLQCRHSVDGSFVAVLLTARVDTHDLRQADLEAARLETGEPRILVASPYAEEALFRAEVVITTITDGSRLIARAQKATQTLLLIAPSNLREIQNGAGWDGVFNQASTPLKSYEVIRSQVATRNFLTMGDLREIARLSMDRQIQEATGIIHNFESDDRVHDMQVRNQRFAERLPVNDSQRMLGGRGTRPLPAPGAMTRVVKELSGPGNTELGHMTNKVIAEGVPGVLRFRSPAEEHDQRGTIRTSQTQTPGVEHDHDITGNYLRGGRRR